MKHKIKFRNKYFLITLLIFVAITVQTGMVQSYTSPNVQENGPFKTVSISPELLIRKADIPVQNRILKNNKLDLTLVDLSSAEKVSGQSAKAMADAKMLRVSDNRVQVQITIDKRSQSAAEKVITLAGGEVTGVANDSSTIQAWLPIDSLEAVAADENIFFIRQPAPLELFEDVKAGNSNTEGLSVINGLAWHSAGITGSGVKIAIVDGGFLDYDTLLGSDLPATVTIKNFVDGEADSLVDGTTIHGTACAEIIYDIAPESSLYLVKVGTNIDLQEAVAWLINSAQVDIISTSLGWYNITPGDGTGEFADLVQTARDAGILWTTAASNDREAHWGGSYNDLDDDGIHDYNAEQNFNYFGPGNGDAYLISSGYSFRVFVRWDDWTAITQDFDLYIWRFDIDTSTWTMAGSGTNDQNGGAGQSPTEWAFATTTGTDAVYGFTIECYSCSRNVNFEVFAPKMASLDESLAARSLSNLADSPAAITVAALDVTPPYPQEYYSSEGPTNGPGGTAAGGFNKPDISGYANVSTESYGSVSKFNGTSAATPHVAGAAALVLSAFPAYTPAQIQTYLEGNAIDMGVAGPDSIYGYGRLYLGDVPISTPLIDGIVPSIGLNTGISHVTISGSDFASGATVKLTRSGQPDLIATNVVVGSTTTITADIDLSGASPGTWNVVVTNTDSGTAQLDDGFLVTGINFNIYLPLILKN